MSTREHWQMDVDWPKSERSTDQQQHESGSIDPPEADWINDRRPHEGRNDHQNGSVGEADELLGGLQRSLAAAASGRRPHPPLRSDYEWSNNRPGKNGVAAVNDEIREREEVLERLRRDLDRMLQSPKVA